MINTDFPTQLIPKLNTHDCSQDLCASLEEGKLQSFSFAIPKYDYVEHNQLSKFDSVNGDQIAHAYMPLISSSKVIEHDTSSKSNDFQSDLVLIEQNKDVSNDTDLTVCVPKYNSKLSYVSPSHSHHFSDGFIQVDEKKLSLYSHGDAHHPRGSSVTYNISVC